MLSSTMPVAGKTAAVAISFLGVAVVCVACGNNLVSGSTPLSLSPDTVSLAVGDSVQMSLEATEGSGEHALSGVKWWSGNPLFASVDADGVVHGHNPGFTIITGTRGGRTETAPVAVGKITYANIDSVIVALNASDSWNPIRITHPAKALDNTLIDGNVPTQPTHWTSTVWANDSIYHAYSIWPDGQIAGQDLETFVIWPLGTIRVLVVTTDNGTTDIAQVLNTTWVAAQDSVNHDLVSLFDSLGTKPLLQFQSRNILASADSLTDPSSPDSVFAYVRRHLISHATYDILVSFHPGDGSGGFASPVFGFVSFGVMGSYAGMNYCANLKSANGVLQLNRACLDADAYGIYDHEIGHLFGWRHNWGGGPPGIRVVTNPALFGWTDVDGDGVPEIIDSTPYGSR